MKDVYDIFLKNSYNSILGVTVIDSGKPGKNIGILGITHGNEPVGLQVFDFLVHDFKISEKLQKGKLFLIANNIEAYKKYRESKDPNAYRFLDNNLNRITHQTFQNESYEHRRFAELKTIFHEIDTVIDLHSVSKGNDIIGITDKKYRENAKKFFNVETILIDDVSKTGAIIGEFLRKGKQGYGLECGNHISHDGFEKGKENVLNFLGFFGYIQQKIRKNHYDEIYEFIEEIRVKTKNFTFTKKVGEGFTKIKKGEIYARDGKENLTNTFHQEIFVGIPTKKPIIGDGAGFLFFKKQ
ncbi:hypothetical protein CSB09_03255 [Candidatus Gracilibacteria bacterium]|nr:MAG: hypothetical protein CSB09_03255 [Candidatus Gracilibacteria bacterium]